MLDKHVLEGFRNTITKIAANSAKQVPQIIISRYTFSDALGLAKRMQEIANKPSPSLLRKLLY